MVAFIIRRTFQATLVLFITAVVVFLGVYAIGDPLEILLPGDATATERAQVAAALRLDDPLPVQFLHFVGNALTGDFGQSFVYNRPTLDVIFERLPATLELVFTALVLSLLIGIPLGLWAGAKPNSMTDETIMTGSILGFSLPNCLPPLIVIGTIQVASAIAAEATLSFLGIGLPITEPSLGLLIANGYQVLLAGHYWMSVYPGLLLLVLFFSINIVGDRLREVFNPRLAT